MGNNYVLEQLPDYSSESFDFDDLQSALELQLEDHFSDLSDLNLDLENIGNPASLEETISSVVWEQVINQIGTVAGDEFIKENRGLTLDLRKSAHTQTTSNFEKGKIATHNSEIDFQERYDSWQSKLAKDADGNIKTHPTRSGRNEANLAPGARHIFDIDRPSGSKDKRTDMDHTISAGEIIRNSAANAHLEIKEQVNFANGSKNLHEMDASQNRSKKDTPMTEWLDNPNSKGYKPREIFDIDDKLDKEYRKKDEIAREEFEKVIKNGEEKSIKTGEKSRQQEAFRIGGKALQAVLMGLLADLVKKIIQKLIIWLTTAKKNFTSFLDSLKDAISNFLKDLKKHLVNATDTLLTTIATAIFGPIVNMVKKAWIFIKQGYRSVKEALNHLKDPNNKGKSLSVLMLEVGKIITAGLTVGGAIVLGEVIEKSMSAIPFLAFPIPVVGSLASILGICFGAIGSGIIGALALNLIDRMIANKKRSLLTEAKISKSNEIIAVQGQLIHVVSENLQITKGQLFVNADERHTNLSENLNLLLADDTAPNNSRTQNDDDIDELFSLLNA